MEIKRDLYLQKLIDRKGNGLIKVITGMRRSGKSYLLNVIFYDYLRNSGVKSDHIIKFAFDSAADLSKIGEDMIALNQAKRKADPNKFLKYVESKIVDDDTYYLLLDEVQLLDCFEAVLNSYLNMRNIDVYVTGSNAKFLSKDVITEFAGRGDEISVRPLSFAEFMSVYKGGDKYDGLTEYMLYGGIPMVVLREGNENKAEMLQHLFEEIYLKDIETRYKVRNKGEMEDLLNILSSSIGSLTNAEKLKNTFRSVKNSNITSPTIKKYIDYFCDCFLLEPAFRYDIKGREYISTPLKYYFSDLGLRNARLNFRQIEQPHSLENLIYNELRYRGFSVDVGLIYAKEGGHNKNLEVDFVCNLGSKRYYIQSAYSLPSEEKTQQEVRPFRNISDSFKKIVITGDNTPLHYNDEGILFMNIFDFLLKEGSLEA